MFQQPLQQKQITKSKRLVLAGWRHVASCTRESRKDFAWRACAVLVQGGVERGRMPVDDHLRDTSRMLIGRRGLWLGSAHRCHLRESGTVVGICVAAASKSAKSTPKPACGFRQLDAGDEPYRRQSRVIS